MIEIRYGRPLGPGELETIEHMQAEAYGADIFTNPGLEEERLRRCSDFFVTAYDGERLVGAWCTYPVKEGLWDVVCTAPHILDDDVDPDWIVPLRRDGPNDIMAFDLVIDPAYRGRGIARELLDGFRALLGQKVAQGYAIRRFYGYVITYLGYHMMMRYGAVIRRCLPEGELFSIDPARFLRDGAVPGAVPPPPTPLAEPVSEKENCV